MTPDPTRSPTRPGDTASRSRSPSPDPPAARPAPPSPAQNPASTRSSSPASCPATAAHRGCSPPPSRADRPPVPPEGDHAHLPDRPGHHRPQTTTSRYPGSGSSRPAPPSCMPASPSSPAPGWACPTAVAGHPGGQRHAAGLYFFAGLPAAQITWEGRGELRGLRIPGHQADGGEHPGERVPEGGHPHQRRALYAEAQGQDTLLRGAADQAALHGVLAQIEALGLELPAVRRVPPASRDPARAVSAVTAKQLNGR